MSCGYFNGCPFTQCAQSQSCGVSIPGTEANRAWIEAAQNEGKEIVDIGPDFGRRLERQLQGERPDSPFYNMERQWSEKVGRKSSSDRVGSVVEYQVLTSSSAKEFLHACDEALGFLRGYGFSNPMFSGEAAARNGTTRFYGKYLAVECIWDSVEQAVEVKVARLRDGKPPGEFAMDANGRRVREHLTTLLVRRGVETSNSRGCLREHLYPSGRRRS